MAYATEQDMLDLIGEDALSALADRDGDFVADATAVIKALDAGATEIDAYIGARYPLPLKLTSPTLRQINTDIAVYRLGVDGGTQTDENRERYKDAIKLLGRIGDGKAVLVFDADPDAETLENPDERGPRPIIIEGPDRIFSREKTRGL